jgi:hypothetical protein
MFRESVLHPLTTTEIQIANAKPVDFSTYRHVTVHSKKAAAWAIVRESFRLPIRTGFLIHIEPKSTRNGVDR